MIPDETKILEIIEVALKEDLGEGDHTSQATILEGAKGGAKLLVKEKGILAGVELAELIFKRVDPELSVEVFMEDGEIVKPRDTVFQVKGSSRSILSAERLVLNFMQRMSGIATKTNRLTKLIEDLPTQVLDTRKTTPGIRLMEKWAVRIGGGNNHRFGLYDMIMIKDNHIDYAGGIRNAIFCTKRYLNENSKDLRIEIETRNLGEVKEVLEVGHVDRILLDNFTPDKIREALKLIDSHQFETEASGSISEDSIREYAETGVDYISSGAVTHSYKSLDLSLRADLNGED